MANTSVSFASGAQQSRTVRYYQDLRDPINDITWINESTNILTTDIDGRPIDFNKDGQTDALFLNGSVSEMVGYTSTPNQFLIACTRDPQGEVAFGGGRGGGSALSVINLPDAAGLCGFPEAGSITGSVKVAVLDINNDGYQDIYAANNHAWLFDPATGLFKPGISTVLRPGATGPGEATLADFNGDGIPDMAWTDYEYVSQAQNGDFYASSYTLYFGVANSEGDWNLQFEEHGDLEPIVLDIDPIQNSKTFSSTGAGGTLTPQSHTGFPDVTPVARDFDGDGDIDLAVSTETGIRLFSNPGNGKFDAATAIDIASGTGAAGLFLKVADFNGDGLLDLVSSPNSNSPAQSSTNGPYNDVDLTIYLNTSSAAGISMAAQRYAGLNGSGVNGPIATADMNLDGFSDLVMAPFESENTRFYIALSDGTGQFRAPTAWVGFDDGVDPIGNNSKRTISDLAIGDFNGDGQMDVASMAAAGSGDKIMNAISGVAYNTTFVAPSTTELALPEGRKGIPYFAQIAGEDGDSSKPYSFALSPNSPPLPTGLTLASNGTITGTPESSGSFSFLVDVTQSNGLKGSANLSIQLDAAFTTPSITDSTLPEGRKGTPYSAQLIATGGDSSKPYTFVLSPNSTPLPAGLSLAADGTISGTPQSSGSFSFLVDVTQTNGLKGSSSLSIQLDEVMPPASTVKATRQIDQLIGTAAVDAFVFADPCTGRYRSSDAIDTIRNVSKNDQIEIQGLDVSVIAASGSQGVINQSVGTARDAEASSINRLLGSQFQSKGGAAVFQIMGENGSFLAINSNGNGFEADDMLVHLEYFTPSAESPLTLISTSTPGTVPGGTPAAIDDLQGPTKPFVLDLAASGATSLPATAKVSREAKHDSSVGFYRVLNLNGDVRDPVSNEILRPGDFGYEQAALASANRVTDTTLSAANNVTAEKQLVFANVDCDLVGMFGQVTSTGERFFGFAAANADGYQHFNYLASNKVGFEDTFGGGDRDHNDLIVNLSFG